MKCTQCGSDMMQVTSGMVCRDGCGRIVPPLGRTVLGIIPPGCSVRFGKNRLGVVVAVKLESADRLTYQVAYWTTTERKTVWLDDCEIQLADGDAQPIRMGFANGTLDQCEPQAVP